MSDSQNSSSGHPLPPERRNSRISVTGFNGIDKDVEARQIARLKAVRARRDNRKRARVKTLFHRSVG